jgi:hypothetical protein
MKKLLEFGQAGGTEFLKGSLDNFFTIQSRLIDFAEGKFRLRGGLKSFEGSKFRPIVSA